MLTFFWTKVKSTMLFCTQKRGGSFRIFTGRRTVIRLADFYKISADRFANLRYGFFWFCLMLLQIKNPVKHSVYRVLGEFDNSCCDLDRIQTCNLLSRNQMRYSVAPRGLFAIAVAKIHIYFNNKRILN